MERLRKFMSSDYFAGLTAAWAVYTPVFAVLEFYQGISTDEVFWNRAFGMGVQTFVGPTMQGVRRILGRLGGIYDDQKIKKFLIGEGAVALIQPPTYAAILGASALANGQSFSEYFDSCWNLMLPGVAVSLAVAPIFTWGVDKWKDYLRAEDSTFMKRESSASGLEEMAVGKTLNVENGLNGDGRDYRFSEGREEVAEALGER